MSLDGIREAQRRWGARSLSERLAVVRGARHAIAAQAMDMANAISPVLVRSKTDTLAAEVLPLLDACKFLERNAAKILRPRKLGLSGRPLWLAGVWSEIYREPLGHVLVIGPSNFPLFLAGVQVMQALAAGNSVTWKPGAGGAAVAELVAAVLRDAGLPRGVLQVIGESVAQAQEALEKGADKVVFTGSVTSGRAVAGELAKTSTPAIMELSGADAVIVLPSADLARVVKAVTFGLRLNGGAVCMSPRRLFATAGTLTKLRPMLTVALKEVPAVALTDATAQKLQLALEEAVDEGAVVHGKFQPRSQKPLAVDRATGSMTVATMDVFAPVLSLIEVPSIMHVPELHAKCAYGLAVAVFGDEEEARTMAHSLCVGSVLINDVIVPTADPRVPFGGRGASGFGVTRGAEGLLEMTAVKTLLVRRGRSALHLEPTRDADAPMLAQAVLALHGRKWSDRWRAVRALMSGVKR